MFKNELEFDINFVFETYYTRGMIMRKILLPLLAICLISGFLYFNHEGKAKGLTNTTNLKGKIERVSALSEADQVKVNTIEKRVRFNKNMEAILFTGRSKGIGYAVLREGKPVSVVYQDTMQGYDQFKSYSIIFGKKPRAGDTHLNLIINTDANHKDIRKTIKLGSGDFYLIVQKLPANIKRTKVSMNNYTFK